MPPRTRATFQSRWWKTFFRSFKYCTQCGGRLKRTYVKEEKSRRHVCIKCKQITYINPKVVAGLIPINNKGEILLLKRNIEPALGRWTYPAGFQELGETLTNAAVRETKEETGVKVKIGRLVGIYSYPHAGVVTIVYQGKVAKGQRPKVTPEAQEVKFVGPSKIPWKELAFLSTVDALKDWLKNGKQSS